MENDKTSVYRKRGNPPLYLRMYSLQRLTKVLEDMESGLLPVSEQTKKAMQAAIKETCTAFANLNFF